MPSVLTTEAYDFKTQYKNVNFKTKYVLNILGWKTDLVQLRKKDRY